MDTKPRLGSIVYLNDTGLQLIFGSAVGLSYMKALPLTIIHVSEESMTYPELSYDIEVDNPDINQFMLCSQMFDYKE